MNDLNIYLSWSLGNILEESEVCKEAGGRSTTMLPLRIPCPCDKGSTSRLGRGSSRQPPLSANPFFGPSEGSSTHPGKHVGDSGDRPIFLA